MFEFVEMFKLFNLIYSSTGRIRRKSFASLAGYKPTEFLDSVHSLFISDVWLSDCVLPLALASADRCCVEIGPMLFAAEISLSAQSRTTF